MSSNERRRRRPVVVRQLPLLLVLSVLVAGLVIVLVDGGYERGSVVFAGAVVLAGLLRAVLPARWAGQLRVRSRWLDTLMLLVVGAGTLAVVLALSHDWDGALVMQWLRGSE